jgi:16S rRNA (cytosine967-C5)-methyltransferase
VVTESSPLTPAPSERRLSTIPWRALEGLGPTLAPALQEILSGAPAERVLDKLLRAHRDFSPEQRQVTAESLFGVGLWRRRLRSQLALTPTLSHGEREALALLDVLTQLPSLRPPENWRDRFSFPDWIADLLEQRFGPDAAHVAEAFNRPGPVCLRSKGPREQLQRELAEAGIESHPGKAASHSLVVTTPRPNLLGLGPQFLGRFEVQDEGSQLLGELVDVREGDEVLDLCAGAGGKSLQLASLVGREGKVHATDIDLPRLERLRTRAAKANARVLIHGKEAPESLRVPRVLIDAPCSELGTLRRGPDLRWRIDPGLVTSMPALQLELIAKGMRHLAPGGKLIYATCTFTFEENERVIEKAPRELKLVKQMFVDPFHHGTDCFFGAVFERK